MYIQVSLTCSYSMWLCR